MLLLLLLLLLQGKPFAVFGCGDAVRFKNNYANAVGEVCIFSHLAIFWSTVVGYLTKR
jgi:hypothetical protein